MFQTLKSYFLGAWGTKGTQVPLSILSLIYNNENNGIYKSSPYTRLHDQYLQV